MTEIDPYPISALQDRYGLDSKQAIYDRINKLGIQPVARGKLSLDQLDMLDRLDKHIKKGGTIRDFINPNSLPPHPENKPLHEDKSVDLVDLEYGAQPSADGLVTVEEVCRIIERVATAIRPTTHLSDYEELERAAEKGWILPTSIVKQLIGVRPTTTVSDRFTRGSFVFIRSGKIGGSAAWKVQKIP